MKKIALALALCGACLASSQASATTVDILVTDGGVPQATGSFSYATGTTGVLGYGNLTSFSISLVGVTYTLADVMSLTSYSQFAYDTATNTLETNTNACGYAGCGFSEILGAVNSSGSDGFFFEPPGGVYLDYSSDTGGMLDAITLTPTTGGAVPEPASWALMMAGFGLIGCALRSRSTARTAVAYS